MTCFGKTMLGLLAMLALSACDTVRGWTGSDTKAPSESPVSITPRAMSATAGAGATPAFAGTQGMSGVTSLSGGSVEVYTLDGNAPTPIFSTYPSQSPSQLSDAGSTVPSVTRDYSGVTLASDPSVTVFPIDGDMSVGTGSIYGQTAEWPNTQSSSVNSVPLSLSSSKPVPSSGAGVSSVYFSYGSAQLGGKDRSALDGIAETAKFAPVDRVRVEGHASPETQASDPVEARILNLRESLKRASVVSEKLIKKGVPAEKIQTVGWGDTLQSGGGKEQQRRVDILTGGN